MNKKLLFVFIILVIAIVNFILFSIFTKEETIEITGQDIHDALSLDDCYRIFIRSVKYRGEEGSLIGNENNYAITMEDNQFDFILDLVKKTNSEKVETKDFIPPVIDQITHEFQFHIESRTSGWASYSIITNKIAFLNDDDFRELTQNDEFVPQVIILEMDDRFKDVMSEFK